MKKILIYFLITVISSAVSIMLYTIVCVNDIIKQEQCLRDSLENVQKQIYTNELNLPYISCKTKWEKNVFFCKVVINEEYSDQMEWSTTPYFRGQTIDVTFIDIDDFIVKTFSVKREDIVHTKRTYYFNYTDKMDLDTYQKIKNVQYSSNYIRKWL